MAEIPSHFSCLKYTNKNQALIPDGADPLDPQVKDPLTGSFFISL